MKLTKFEKRKQEILRKHEEELRALEEQELKEREKMVEPVIDKIRKVAEEEARKILEKSPEILETYSFKKREAGKAISDALEALFAATDEQDEVEEMPQSEDATPLQETTPSPVAQPNDSVQNAF